ncbi:MAG: hypothetical protein FWC03_03130 [Treponema sp.]|nr:hypothetical protein [Treponema sp.]
MPYKTTFNCLLTSKIIPHKFYSNLSLFYEKIMTNPKNIQLFMQNCVKTAIEITKKNPEIEPGKNPDWASIEQFKIEVSGDHGKNITVISMPYCNKNGDCRFIAIPCIQEKAGYFTCELTTNPINGESIYITAEWTEGFRRSNHGQTDGEKESFAAKVKKIIYGSLKDFESPTSNNEIEDLLAGFNEKPKSAYPNLRAEDPLDDDPALNEGTISLMYSGLARYRDGKFREALDHFSNLLETENSEAAFFHFRSVIRKAIGNDTAADYDLFRAKLLDIINNNNQVDSGIYEGEWESELGLGQRKPLIETDKWHNILRKKDGKPLLCIRNREGEARLPEIFYSGGKNALVRRRMDQYVLISDINKDARETLSKTQEIHVAEFLPDIKKKDDSINKSVIREYRSPVRLLPENISLDSAQDICTDGYLLFTSLASMLRANADKPVKDVIARDDLPNLASILVREEDYRLLDKCAAEGVSLNERVGWYFKSWQPTPLFYITLNKIWYLMKDPVKMLNYLKKNKADFDLASIEGDTPLGNQCTLNGSPEIMKALLDCGANSNADTTSGGYSIKPLQLVLFPGEFNEEQQTFTPYRAVDAEKARLLIEGSADVNADNEGLTPLAQAITYGRGNERAGIVTLLYKRGADVDAALKYMEGLAKEGSAVYCYALYEFYAGLPDSKIPMPWMAAWKNPDTAQYYLELSEKTKN